jgi:hypothetical protein
MFKKCHYEQLKYLFHLKKLLYTCLYNIFIFEYFNPLTDNCYFQILAPEWLFILENCYNDIHLSSTLPYFKIICFFHII